MKIVSKDGKLWVEQRDKHFAVGFTRQFLGELDGCWHMLPAASQKTEIKEKQPLVAVETNDGLFSLPSPISGVIAFFDNKAMNFPEKLTDEDVVCTIKDAEAVRAEEKDIQERHERAVEQLLARQVERQAQARPVIGAEQVNHINVAPPINLAFFDEQAAGPARPVVQPRLRRGGF